MEEGTGLSLCLFPFGVYVGVGHEAAADVEGALVAENAHRAQVHPEVEVAVSVAGTAVASVVPTELNP